MTEIAIKGDAGVEEKKACFEEAVSELESIISRLEKGELTLDESIEFFQRGVELSKYCSKRLDEVEKRISILIEDGKGNIKEESFKPEV